MNLYFEAVLYDPAQPRKLPNSSLFALNGHSYELLVGEKSVPMSDEYDIAMAICERIINYKESKGSNVNRMLLKGNLEIELSEIPTSPKK